MSITAAGAELAAAFDRPLAELLPTRDLLDAAAEDRPPSDSVAAAVRDLGLLEVGVPESHGGLGLDLADLAAIWRVAGQRLLPTLFRARAMAVAPVLARARGAASGDLLDTFRRGGLRTGGGAVPRAGEATGVVQVFLDPEATLAVVIGRDRADAFALDPACVRRAAAVEPGQGLALLTTAGLSAVASLDGGEARGIWEAWQVAALADAAGTAERALELSVDYARMRRQFGRPIAEFQAVAHLLATMRVWVDAARSTMARLCALDDQRAREDLLTVAAFAVPDMARRTCEAAIQVHGGTGFTWEYGLHLHYRRALQIQASFGGAREAAVAVGRLFTSGTT